MYVDCNFNGVEDGRDPCYNHQELPQSDKVFFSFCGLGPGQRLSGSLYRRNSSSTRSSLTGDDVHELHLRFQPHSS